jgi:hypothetical protein
MLSAMNRWDDLINTPRAAQLRKLLCQAAAMAHTENGERFAPEDLGDDARIYGICTSNSARFLAAHAIEEADLDGVIVRERGLVWWLEVDRGTDPPVHVYFYKAPPAGSTVWDLRLDDADVKRTLSASNGRQLELFTSSGAKGNADLLNVIVVHYGDPRDGPGKLDVGAPYISNGELSWDWQERFDVPEDGVGANSAPGLGDDPGGFEGLSLIESLPGEDGVGTEMPGQSRREMSDSRGSVGYGELQVRHEPAGDEQQNEGTGEESS